MDFQLSWVEWIGFIVSLVYLYFSINQKIWLWPMGLLSSIFYVIVFLVVHLYADMILQVYYLIVSLWGWIFWKKKQENDKNKNMPIIKTSLKDFINISIAFIVLYLLLVLVLLKLPAVLNITSSAMPYLDAFTTAGSFVATWMLVKKRIEQWLFWIVIDIVSMGMYIYKGLHPTALLYLIYTVMAIGGYVVWLKEYKKQLGELKVYN